MPELKVVIDGETTATYSLTGETVTLGRDVENTIVLPDKAASAAHAHILAKPDGWQIADLNSTNGTLVNGQPIQSVNLRDGDCIKIGTTEIVFAGDDEPRNRVSDSSAGSGGYLQSILEGASSIVKTDESLLTIDDAPSKIDCR